MKRIGTILGAGLLLALAICAWWIFSRPERDTTGSIGTEFRWLGSNDNKDILQVSAGPDNHNIKERPLGPLNFKRENRPLFLDRAIAPISCDCSEDPPSSWTSSAYLG